MASFEIQTPKNKFKIEYFSCFIEKEKVKTNKELFSNMCEEGCKNYGKKYSCPPFSPNFINIIKNHKGLFIVLFLCKLNQINSTQYNKIRIVNVVMKSRIIKLMRLLENKFKTIFLSTGSCNLCKPCQLKLNKPCKHPNKKRYCLESTGIDCDYLSKKLFKTHLLWYKNKKAPEYTCVMCGLLCNKNQIENIKKEAEKIIRI